MTDDPKRAIDIGLLTPDIQDLLLNDILAPKMTRFCLLNLEKGWPGGKSIWHVDNYVADGNNYHISLVDQPGALIHTDTRTVVGNVVSLLRQVFLRDRPMRSPEGAAKEFLRSLVEPPEWTKVELATLAPVWFRDIMPSLSDNFLIDQWLYRKAVGLLYAPRSSLKSFVALDQLLTLAAGMKSWYGFDTQPCGAFYLAAEGAEGMRERVHAFRLEHGLEDRNLPFVLLPSSLNLLDPHQTTLLIQVIRECQEQQPMGILAVDTVAKTMRGGDENSFPVISTYLESLERIRDECDITVMGIAHAGKDVSRGARGHSSLEADVDFVIRCERDEESGVVAVEVTKQKDAPDGAVLHFNLKHVEIGKSPSGRSKISGVLEPANPDAATKIRLALGPDQDEYDALTNVLLTKGRKVHRDGIPNETVVTVDEWLDEVIKRGLLPPRAEWKEADRKAWYRKRTRLREKGLIRVYEDFLWLFRTPAEIAEAA